MTRIVLMNKTQPKVQGDDGNKDHGTNSVTVDTDLPKL